MTSTKYGLGQFICGIGGTLLIASLFLPWAGGAGGDLTVVAFDPERARHTLDRYLGPEEA